MATKKKSDKSDIWDALAEAFDPDDFRVLVKEASPSTRLNAYINIVKLLTYRSKTTGDSEARGEIDEMIDKMFEKK